MESLLLTTKLQIPPRSQHVIRRGRLVAALENEIAQRKLVLLSAPAGYGKTTLLIEWAHATHFDVAWLSLGAEDNELRRFLRYMLAAWATAQPGVKESRVGVLLGARIPDTQAALSAFINVASSRTDHVVFFLDDYHVINAPAIHQTLTFLLDHLPPTSHFVLAGRIDPPLPIARYRARHDLLEFGASDLRFSMAETETFLSQKMALTVSQDAMTALQARLEGWPAGVQLAALAIRRGLDRSDNHVITGQHRFIADYLSEDVLARLSDTTKQLMLQVSIVDRVCGSLCDAVTGRDDGQVMLERLERENLFWFRWIPGENGFVSTGCSVTFCRNS